MKSLEEFNKERQEYFELNSNKPRPNGIKCPECGKELMDSSPMIVLCSIPPKKDVYCKNCKYTGYRNA